MSAEGEVGSCTFVIEEVVGRGVVDCFQVRLGCVGKLACGKEGVRMVDEK